MRISAVFFVLLFGFLALAEVPQVLEYGFCRADKWPCPERTRVFRAEDEAAYAWVKFGLMSEGHTVRWEWVSPDGKVYRTAVDEIPAPEQWHYWSWYVVRDSLPLRGTPAARMPGKWKLNVLVDRQKMVTMEFELLPSFETTPPSPSGERPKDNLRSGYWPYTEGKPLVNVLVQRKDRSAQGDWLRVERVLIDTGAEYSLFPRSVADQLGLNLFAGENIRVLDLSGTPITAWVHEIWVSLLTPEGKSFVPTLIRVAFAETEIDVAILGRVDVLDKFVITLESKGFRIDVK